MFRRLWWLPMRAEGNCQFSRRLGLARYNDDSDERGQGGRSRRYSGRRKTCAFCEGDVAQIDYKRADVLRRFLTDRGKIRPRRQTGTCARHQRQLAMAVKRARHLALLPFVVETQRGR
jgi:small subunit ribosomal protein S18